MAYLQIENFKKNYGDVEALKGVSLSLEKGSVLSIIGSSGCGKTTLLRCINFLETPCEGVMTLDGERLFDASEVSAKEKVSDGSLRKKRLNFGLVFQSFNLFPQYDVTENVTLAPLLMLKDEIKRYRKELKKQKIGYFDIKNRVKEYETAKKVEISEKAQILLKKTGLSDKAKAYPHELSGGQRQRVAIARALALKPKILCFDEPTSALDPELTGEVLKVIEELKGADTTMIIVTHEMEFAKKISDKVIFMSNGEVVETGTSKEVFENSKSDKVRQFLQGYDK